VNPLARSVTGPQFPLPVLVGYRATGKTTVAGGLAGLLGCEHLDADEALEAESGCTIAQLIADRGEPAFRDAETKLLSRLLDCREAILATGGGVVLRLENRRLLRQAGRPVIWLTAPAAEIRRRLAADPTTASRRPALAGRDVLDEVEQALGDREPRYREVADVCFDTAAMSRDELVATIAAWLAARFPAPGASPPVRRDGP